MIFVSYGSFYQFLCQTFSKKHTFSLKTDILNWVHVTKLLVRRLNKLSALNSRKFYWYTHVSCCVKKLILCTQQPCAVVIYCAAGFELHSSAALSLSPFPFCSERKPKWMQRADVSVLDVVSLAALVPPGWWCTLKSPSRGTMTRLMSGCRFSQRGLCN